MFWKREGDSVKPVLDLIFNGKGRNSDQWFRKDRLVEKRIGPNIGGNFNYFSDEGHGSIKRNYFINRNYGGCQNDFGFVIVSDKPDNCKGVWVGGRGWESFPRFLYAGNPNGCRWADANCVREADIMTVSLV